MWSGSVISLVVTSAYLLTCAVAQQPNILFVVIDDWGYRDAGFMDEQFQTPTLDRMWKKGVRFNQSYTTPDCGPSRAALLSGLFPFRLGLQGKAIDEMSPAAIPLDKPMLPQTLQTLGYQTHLVGKWNQGFCNESYTPTMRGFDSFYGFYLDKQDHYTHKSKDFFDFRQDLEVDKSVKGKYSTEIYSERVRDIVRQYNSDVSSGAATKPFFIMLSHAAINSPLQVPRKYRTKKCRSIKNKKRRKKCAMMLAVDEGLRNITNDLRDLGLLSNTLVVVTSDNGGHVKEGSSNWPLRGSEGTLWEGGIRVNTLFYSESKDILPKTNYTFGGMIYITDFYATLVGMVTKASDKKIPRGIASPKVRDSMNLWPFISEEKIKSYRRRFVYVDQDRSVAMIRHKQFKLIYQETSRPGWYNPPDDVRKPNIPSDLPTYLMFDIENDPREKDDVKNDYPDLWNKLAKKLTRIISKRSLPPISARLNSDPRRFDNVWSSGWCKGNL